MGDALTGSVEKYTRTDSKGVRGVSNFIGWFEVVEMLGNHVHDFGNGGVMHVQDFSTVLVNCQWDIGVFNAHKVIKAGEDAVESANETEFWGIIVAKVEALLSMASILLAGIGQFDSRDRSCGGKKL